MKDQLEEYIRNELPASEYPFEEQHWRNLKTKMDSGSRFSGWLLVAVLLLGSLQISVTHSEFQSRSLSMQDRLQRTTFGTERVVATHDATEDARLLSPLESESAEIGVERAFYSPLREMQLLAASNLSLEKEKVVSGRPELRFDQFASLPNSITLTASPINNAYGLSVNRRLNKFFTASIGIEKTSESIQYNSLASSEPMSLIEDNSYWATTSTAYWAYTDSALMATGWVYTDSVFASHVDSAYVSQIDTVNSAFEGFDPTLTVETVSIPLRVEMAKVKGRLRYGVSGTASLNRTVTRRVDGRALGDVGYSYSLSAGAFLEFEAVNQLNIGMRAQRQVFRHQLGSTPVPGMRSYINVAGYVRIAI